LSEGLDEGEDLLLKRVREVADLLDDLGDDRGTHGLAEVVDMVILACIELGRHGDRSPGFRLFRLYADGRFETEVCWVRD
jgi:hypothetical protein